MLRDKEGRQDASPLSAEQLPWYFVMEKSILSPNQSTWMLKKASHIA
jgi:hypothetical protein